MVKPKIGLSMLYNLSKTFNESVHEITKVDVKFIEVVDDGLHALDKRRVSELRSLGESYGVRYSVHAPFADINIASPSTPLLRTMVRRLEDSLDNARALNAYLWIFHPGLETGISMFYPGKAWIRNRKTVQLLCKTAEDYGVKLAIENVPEPYPFLMKSVEHFKKFYGEFDGNLGLVLDIGHANLNGQIELFIEAFPDRLMHIHVHDNDGTADQHLGIGFGTVNWEKVAKALKRVSYSGTIVVESVEHVHESLRRLEALLV
ncbi:MAG: sugar phosphate isomerase/epimerase family protein [Candidatus Bathyarchaeales archaeon]